MPAQIVEGFRGGIRTALTVPGGRAFVVDGFDRHGDSTSAQIKCIEGSFFPIPPVGVCLCNGSSSSAIVTLGIDEPTPGMVPFSPDGNILAWGDRDGSVTLCDLRVVAAKLEELGDFKGAAMLK